MPAETPPLPRVLACAALLAAGGVHAATCQAKSPATLTPVVELYTSEGCSSCPPADRWLSGLKTAAAEGRVVAQAFHVGYWDYIGWVDRFAAASHTARQREIAAANRLRNIYTPQVVRNGQDWRDYGRAFTAKAEPALAAITLSGAADGAFEALVTPSAAGQAWSAYWTVTEHAHSSKVKAGENAGELLQHDFVVRQYVPAGQYVGTQKLRLRAVAAEGQHPRRVNVVIFEPKTGRPLQALSLSC